jgi:hypothetical protein
MLLATLLFAATLAGATATDVTVSYWEGLSACKTGPAAAVETYTAATCSMSAGLSAAAGSNVYVKTSACGNKDAAWTVTLYTDDSCTTAVPNAAFNGNDACSCQSKTVAGSMEVSMRASCGSSMNDCLYARAYFDGPCGGDSGFEDEYAISGSCVKNAAFFTCNGGTQSSSWETTESGSCSGLGGASGASCGSCGTVDSDDAYAYAYDSSATIQVNCGGYDWTTDDTECPDGKSSGAAAKFSGAVVLSAVVVGAAAYLL